MAPTPPVDRRTVLRRALWAVAAAASGVVATACQGEPIAHPGQALPAEGSNRPGSSPRSDQRSGTGHRPKRNEGASGRGNGGSGDSQGDAAANPEPTAGDAESDGSGDPRHRPEDQTGPDPDDRSDQKPEPTDPDKNKPGGDEPDPGQGDPGGPPPIVATAAVPIGGGIVVPSARVVVTQPTAGAFRCFQNRCTHAGCAVDTVKDGTIHCPCHGSLFAIDSGNPVAGPAPTPLPAVPITVKAGGVFLA